jgi:hypothetical protein
MAKKLSTLVIDATVNTSGIDKAVSTINNKLKGVGGSNRGGSRDGRFSAGVNPLQYVGGFGGAEGSSIGSAFGAALGASAVIRGSVFNAERLDNIRKYGSSSAQQFSKLSTARSNFFAGSIGTNLATKRGEITTEYSKSIMDALQENLDVTTERYNRLRKARGYSAAGLKYQELNRIDRAIRKSFPTAMSSPLQGLSMNRKQGMGDMGGFGGLIGTGGLVASARYLSNFRQNAYGQFTDLDQFVNTGMFDAAKGLRNTGFATKGTQRTLTQSLLLGGRALNPSQPSTVESVGGGIQDYYNNMMFGLGSFLSSPLETIGQSLVPGSPLRQMAGEDPNNLGAFAKAQRSVMDMFASIRRSSV